ncbi:hypothetical protein [Rubripirellula obstinata]|nr:hypothetical protein [Rubripirellula obstinata]
MYLICPTRKPSFLGFVLGLFVVTLTFSSASPALAETAGKVEELGDGQQRVTLTQTVEPSFHIEPIVHRFAARRGTTIPFRFEIRSTGKAMNVSVLPVKLRQEMSGIILHDATGEAPDEIKFTSPTEFKLAPGETTFIEGEVTVPLAKSNYLSFGVLVRDNGQRSADDNTDNNGQRIGAAVRFVTQYVLRIDIETGVKDLSQMNQLAFESGLIDSQAGMPVAEAVLVNPTEFAFECNVRGSVESASSSRPRPFRLSMSSRSSLNDEKKYIVRIMPHSKVRVSAPVEETLFPGNQTFKVEVTNGRRAMAEQTYPVSVAGGDFPALEVSHAYLDQELSVGPAQIEVGDSDSAKRSCNLRFSNNSEKQKMVKAELIDLDGQPIEGIRLSSSEFEVKPGRTKTIRASVSTRSKSETTKFGTVRLSISDSEQGATLIKELPLALVVGGRPAESIEMGELQSLVEGDMTSFRLSVTNNGHGYVPIHGQLQVASGKEQAIELADGYGRWLRPGETRELAFQPRKPLPAGKYQLKLHVETTEGAEPFDQTLVVDLGQQLLLN